jgi:hypothetical protein
VFVESIYARLILNQNLNCLFPAELHCLASWHLRPSLVNKLSLLFRVQR